MSARNRSIVGETYGRLTVISPGSLIKHKRFWHCVCSCGKETAVSTGGLTSGHTKSCGCLVVEVQKARAVHGHCGGSSKSPEYIVWEGIIQRTTNPNTSGYKNYGGRGIDVAPQWRDFITFLSDMNLDPAVCTPLRESTTTSGIGLGTASGPFDASRMLIGAQVSWFVGTTA